MSITLDIMILKVLSVQDMYWYQIIQKLREISGNFFSLKTGTVYPILRTMVSKKLVDISEKERGGKPHKYYTITSSGLESLYAGVKEWTLFYQTVNKVLDI